eukprot:3455408-Rhodomonas_salina.1
MYWKGGRLHLISHLQSGNGRRRVFEKASQRASTTGVLVSHTSRQYWHPCIAYTASVLEGYTLHQYW